MPGGWVVYAEFRPGGGLQLYSSCEPLSPVPISGLAGHAVALFLIVLCPAPASADPEAIARLFVKRVQAGDVAGAKKLFGDPKLRSQPRAGDDAYFVYESGESRNLAFLVGRPFDVGPLSMRESRSEWFIIDGVLYAYVTVPLSFRPEGYQPYLLPPQTAFGQKMPFSAFMNFVAAPESEMRDVPLRLRPGVEPGLLPPPGPARRRTAAAGTARRPSRHVLTGGIRPPGHVRRARSG